MESKRKTLYMAAALSMVTALTHLWVMPEYFEEWWRVRGFSWSPPWLRVYAV